MVMIQSNLGTVADGDPVVIARNYAPSLYGPTVPVEVRRNKLSATSAASPAGMFGNFSNSTSTNEPDPKGSGATVRKIVTTAALGGLTQNVVTGVNFGAALNLPAGVCTGTALVLGEAGKTYRVSVQEYSPALALRSESSFSFVATGEWQTITHQNTLTASDSKSRVAVLAMDASEFYVWGFSLEAGATSGGIILPGYPSPDVDMTPSYVGTAAASEIVLTGLHPTGFTDSGCVSIIHEVGDGSRELRQIPTGASTNTRTNFNVATLALSGGTVIGTRRLDAPLTGTLKSDRQGVIAYYGADGIVAYSSPAQSNTPGTYQHRLIYPQLAASGVRVAGVAHGGSVGSGDVYWSNIGLYAGNYTGDFFTGDTVSGDPHIVYGWDGTPHASPATKSYKRFKYQSTTTPVFTSGWEQETEARSVVHHLVAGGAPVVTARPSSLRSGTLTLLYDDEVLAHEAARMLAGGGIYQHFTGNPYAMNDPVMPDRTMKFIPIGRIALSYDAASNGEHTWVITCNYQEVVT